MLTVIVSYEAISPAVLADNIKSAFGCLCSWRELDEDFFEFSVYCCRDLAELEDVLAEYV